MSYYLFQNGLNKTNKCQLFLARMWGKGGTYSLLLGMQTCIVTWQSVWQLLSNLEKDLPQDPAMLSMDKHTKDFTSNYRDTCSQMFIVVLFIIPVQKFKQSRCPPTDMWTMTACYIYTMECCLAIKNTIIQSCR